MEILQKKRILNFVLSHKQEDGGFSFAQEAPATLEDTYFALQILKELQISYDCRKVLKSYLMLPDYTLPKHFFMLARLGITNKINEKLHERLCKTHNAQSLYYLAKTARILSDENLISMVKERIPVKKNPGLLQESCWQAITLKQTRSQFNERGYAKHIAGFQNADGGFGFRRGSTSFLENAYYATEALSLLKQPTINIEKCRKFVELCRAGDGAFGRQIITVPTLESTYHAIMCLKRLSYMRRIKML